MYQQAKEMYARIGVDTERALAQLSGIPLSMHCWQGDDVHGFDRDGALTGGIQTTGNYPGRARTPQELMADIDKALSLVGGKHRINLHASYAIFGQGGFADRDALRPEHFEPWVRFAKARGLGLDMNPTFFSHPMAEGMTLASGDEAVRAFWVRHAVCCLKIAEYFASELGTPCLMNIWIPDGLKDIPADRATPRKRLMRSLDEILQTPYDKSKVLVSVESKYFGIGLESYTVGSHEFYMNYAATRGILCLLDSGHFHPNESIADKIPTLLMFGGKVALHVTRNVGWDSDHVVRFDDETRAIAKEIIQGGAENVLIGLDFFDAGVNRIAAWVTGMRAMQEALLLALLAPPARAALQDQGRFWELMAVQEQAKLMPYGEVWREFLRRNNVEEDYVSVVSQYERDVLSARG